jgi:uncharacterized protein YjbI with pentapeptide repeats
MHLSATPPARPSSARHAVNSDFRGTDFTNAVLDRLTFEGSDMRGAIFRNAVVTGVTWDKADLADSVWEDAIVGQQDAKALCANKSLQGEGRAAVGCR